jgi:hypothetical protein
VYDRTAVEQCAFLTSTPNSQHVISILSQLLYPRENNFSNTLKTGERMDQRASVDAKADYQVSALL